jgi:serine phosphatase RsbU (regulator of sigma subunit)
VLVYTDGVIEVRSPDGWFFELDRLVDMLAHHPAYVRPPQRGTVRCVGVLR